jgi:hypothetical protein
MAADRIQAVNALLVETMEAHERYEETDLKGVYDQQWARWYAAYAVEHGIRDLISRAVTADQLADFLVRTNAHFERADPKPTEPWAAYTARRIAMEL